MDSAGIDSVKLVSLSPLSQLGLLALGLAVVLGVALAIWGVRREADRTRRALLVSLRVLAGLCALFFLLEPGLRRVQVARVKSRVAVLVDRSASMGFPVGPGEPSRSAAVANALEAMAPEVRRLEDRYAFEVLGFDPELSPTSPERLRAEAPRGARTDLLAALRAAKAADSAGGRKLAGVLLFTDGADNVDLDKGLNDRARAVLRELGVPVTTVAVGRDGLKDLAVSRVKVDDFAFVRSAITVEVELEARGLRGEEVPVTLTREGQVVASKTVTLEGDSSTVPVSFTFTPDQTGRFVYKVATPVFPDEAVAENNSRSFTLKVIRDRVRVLLVAGRPTWDERFLRGLLKQDANVELISFYILRSNTDAQTQNDGAELSLIPFPIEEIFDRKLDTFDAVLFLNFGYKDPGLSVSPYEARLEDYVRKGGALVVVGGDRSFGEQHEAFSVLAQAFPVESAGTSDLAPFRARPTPEGLRHPVTALAAGTSSTEQVWAGLPMVPGVNLTRAKPGATVLLEHPFATVEGKNVPVVALWDYGRGRVMTLMTDASWYWAFPAAAQGSTTRAYDRFWSQGLRWLVRDPELTTLQVTADPPSVEPGQSVGVVIAARNGDYQPAAGAQITLELIDAETKSVLGTRVVTAGPDGAARAELGTPPAGAYKVIAKAENAGKPIGETTEAIAVRAVGSELADARVGNALLEELAAATGGKALSLADFALAKAPLLEPPLVEVGRSKDLPLWDRWYWLTLLVVIIGLEWGLRRRFGYV